MWDKGGLEILEDVQNFEFGVGYKMSLLRLCLMLLNAMDNFIPC